MAPPPLNYSTDLNSSQLNAGDTVGGSLLHCNGVCTPPVLESAQFCPSEASSSIPSHSAPVVSPAAVSPAAVSLRGWLGTSRV